MSDPVSRREAPAVTAVKWRDLGIRTLAAAVMVPLALVLIWAGGWWFIAAIAGCGLLMAHEWCRMVHGGSVPQLVLHGVAVILAAAAGAILVSGEVLALGLMAIWGASVLLAWKSGAMTGWGLAGVPYVALPILMLGLLRHGEAGLTAVLLVMLPVWIADIGAYFAGRIIGGPKLAPVISPNKTWAGLGGAVVSAMATALAVWLIAGLPNPSMALLLGALIGFFEQMGDLFESAAKRHFGLKDAGNLIPGHGGILDRVDGLIAASIVAGVIGVLHAGSASMMAQGLLQW